MYYSRYYLKPGANDTGISNEHLRITGPTIPILISIPDVLVSAFSKMGMAINPQAGLALIDTGASLSVVDEVAIRSLGVNPVRKGPVATPNGTSIMNFYPAKFSFPGTPLPAIDFSFVLASPHLQQAQNIIALIGKDVLKYGVFTYNGDGHISLSLNL